MRVWILAGLLAMTVHDASARNCVSGAPDTSFAPLNDPVVACSGVRQVTMGRLWSHGSYGATRLYIVTDTNMKQSAPEGSVTLNTNETEDGVPLYPSGVRPICLAMAEWVMPEYADGLNIPEWPNAFMYQSFYDQNAGTVSITWRLSSFFESNSSYGLNVICSPRPPVPQ